MMVSLHPDSWESRISDRARKLDERRTLAHIIHRKSSTPILVRLAHFSGPHFMNPLSVSHSVNRSGQSPADVVVPGR